MCGRFERHSELGEFTRLLEEPVAGDAGLFAPNRNVSPTTLQPVMRRETDGRTHAALCQWGLVPFWVKTKDYGKPINARIESIADKPMFRAAVRERRRLIPCNGFYEWRKQPGGAKQPFHITLGYGAPLFLAGIWEENHNLRPDRPLQTFAILTTAANQTVASIHDRMPVAVPRNLLAERLDVSSPLDPLLMELANGAASSAFEVHAIAKVGG